MITRIHLLITGTDELIILGWKHSELAKNGTPLVETKYRIVTQFVSQSCGDSQSRIQTMLLHGDCDTILIYNVFLAPRNTPCCTTQIFYTAALQIATRWWDTVAPKF